jgi:hypothetical protein
MKRIAGIRRNRDSGSDQNIGRIVGSPSRVIALRLCFPTAFSIVGAPFVR